MARHPVRHSSRGHSTPPPPQVGSKDAREALRAHSDALRALGLFDIEVQFVLEPLRPVRTLGRGFSGGSRGG